MGPEGKKITLGDTTVNIVFTPGHTVGTFSDVFPVKDHGKTVMVAYSGGTLTGDFGSRCRAWDEYIASQETHRRGGEGGRRNGDNLQPQRI